MGASSARASERAIGEFVKFQLVLALISNSLSVVKLTTKGINAHNRTDGTNGSNYANGVACQLGASEATT